MSEECQAVDIFFFWRELLFHGPAYGLLGSVRVRGFGEFCYWYDRGEFLFSQDDPR